jgi:ABC-type multidrug transport system fused ATPase/permease subunit
MTKYEKFKRSTLGRCLRILSAKDRKKFFAIVFIQIMLGVLDLLGVALIGLLGALAVSGIQSRDPSNKVEWLLNAININDMSFQNQAAIIGTIAAVVLIFRTFLSVLFTRKILFFLSRKGAELSSKLVERLLSQNLLFIQSRTSQETLYVLTHGVSAVTLGVLGTSAALLADGALLFAMTFGLIAVDPTIALSTFIVFSLIGYSLYKLLNVRAKELGTLSASLEVSSNEKITEVLHSYRESVVRNRRKFYSREIGLTRMKLANVLAELSFMPNIGKYVIESSIVLGALVISAFQFLLQDASNAVATLAVFLTAGTRIAPAVLRAQQGALAIRSNLSLAKPTLDFIDSLNLDDKVPDTEGNLDFKHIGFVGSISAKNLQFAYPGSSESAISCLNFDFSVGESIAIVGSSGAGKTTLVDLLLGVLIPESGEVLISGVSPQKAVSKWSGAIAYVPQDVVIVNGNVKENICLGYSVDQVDDQVVWQALNFAELETHFRNNPEGLSSQVGERGSGLSGGQRQRLGIARALFTNPFLLVLDEATSALDGETEAAITNALEKLKGKVTVVMIAHRLSTIRNVDRIIYMDQGKIIGEGDFESLRKKLPEFDRQAKQMGL